MKLESLSRLRFPGLVGFTAPAILTASAVLYEWHPVAVRSDQAVKNDGLALAHAAPELRDDKARSFPDLVTAAIHSVHGSSARRLSSRL